MQNSDNVSIPTLEYLQHRFHAVPRFRDPNKREYVWFHADNVARVFGYSDFNDDLMHIMNHLDCVCYGKAIPVGRTQDYVSLGPQCRPFLEKYKKVINQFGVSYLAQRSRLPFCIQFKYWLYSTYSLTELNNEPILRDLEILEDGSCIIEARKGARTKDVIKKVKITDEEQSVRTETVMSQVSHDIEYERELTKRLEIEKNFQLEMRRLDLRRLEIDHEHYEKQSKKNA